MLRIDSESKKISILEISKLAEENIQERYDLQEMIFNSPEAFVKEIDQKLNIIGKEVCPSTEVDNRIDLLAINEFGSLVIIELKRGRNKYQHLQGISYAAMISSWDLNQIIEEKSKNFNISIEEAKEQIEDFLSTELDNINESQEIFLIAEDFHLEVILSAKWLSDNYSIPIKCFKMILAKDNSTNISYLALQQVFPLPEISDQYVKRKNTQMTNKNISSWSEFFLKITNNALKEFYEKEIKNGVENYLPKKQLNYRVNNYRFWTCNGRIQNAYVWQRGRFEDDLNFWKEKLSSKKEVIPVKNNSSLRFYLKTKDDFQNFKDITIHPPKDIIKSRLVQENDEEIND